MSNLLSILTNPKQIGLFTFKAKCPNCRNWLKATKRRFHCKGCNRNGDAKDYQKWLWKLDQKRLSHLMENGLETKEMSDWWIERY